MPAHTKKPCPWPTCGEPCPLTYSFCSRCSGERWRAHHLGGVDGRPITAAERKLLADAETRREEQRRGRHRPSPSRSRTDVPPELRAGQKRCPWPTCGLPCPVAYSFCMKCQTSRLVARVLGEVDGRPVTDEERALLTALDRHRQAQYRKWHMSPTARAYRREWKKSPAGAASVRRYQGKLQEIRRQFAEQRDRIRWRNVEYRESAMRAAREAATDELLALIDEQRADTDYAKRAKSDPWMMRSLDAPMPGRPELSLGDFISSEGGYWADPTGDMACALADGEVPW